MQVGVFIVFVNASLDILSIHIPDEPFYMLISSHFIALCNQKFAYNV